MLKFIKIVPLLNILQVITETIYQQ